MDDQILRHYGLRDPYADHWKDADLAADPVTFNSNEVDALGTGISVAGILLDRGIVKSETGIPEQYSLNSRAFNARSYIRDVHRKASQADLRKGQEHLIRAIESKTGSLKVLVEENFDRFVGSKRVIDDVYSQITSDFRKTEDSLSRMDVVRNSLNDTSATAARIFEPVIETRRKADRLRMTIGILEKYKTHFDLPSTLLRCIEANDNDALLKEYKKGQTIFKDVRANVGASTSRTMTERRNMRILVRVWSEVERIMKVHETTVWKALDEQKHLEHETTVKLANFLLELGVDRNPYYRAYCQQIITIKSEVITTLEQSRTHVEILRRHLQLKHTNSKKNRIAALQAYIEMENSPSDSKSNILQSREAMNVWQSVSDLIDLVWSKGIRNLVESWRIVQDMTSSRSVKLLPNGPDGSSRKFHAFSVAEKETAIARAEEAVQLMCHSITDFFGSKPITELPSIYSPISAQTDMQSATSMDAPAFPDLGDSKPVEFSFIPVSVNSLGASKNLAEFMKALLTGAKELHELHISDKTDEHLRSMLTVVRERFIRAICELWQADCEDLPALETWTRVTDADGTELPNTCWLIQKGTINGIKLTMFCDGSNSSLLQFPSTRLLGNIRQQFVKNIYQIINGLMALSYFADPETTVTSSDTNAHEALASRRLLMLQNLTNLRVSTVSKLIQQFESAFSMALTEDLQKLNAMLKQYDSKLFSTYLKSSVTLIEETLTRECGNVDWTGFPLPREISTWTNEVVLHVILVHAQVLANTPSLRPRIIDTVISHIFTHLLSLIQDVPEFNIGAVLQMTLDLEFLGIQFNDSLPQPATDTIERLFEIIESRTNREKLMMGEKSDMKKILQRAKNGQLGQARVFQLVEARS